MSRPPRPPQKRRTRRPAKLPQRMYDILCTFPLRSDLLDLSIHPSLPLVALALASGHVHLLRLPPTTTTGASIETVWRVQRHKNGSCRALSFNHDGKLLITAGYDGIVKIADTQSGKVKAKIAIPRSKKGDVDPPASVCALSKDVIVLATDGGALHVYEGKLGEMQGARPSKTIRDAHPDAHATSVSRLLEEENREVETGRFVTTGGGTVAVVHPRKGVVMETEPVEELLLASAVCCSKAIVGGEEGRLRVWDVGSWDRETIYNVEKGKGAGIDVMACVEDDLQDGAALLALGMEDGTIRFVDVGEGKAKNSVKVRPLEIKHSELDGVAGLGWLKDGRLVSGGGQAIKVWERADAANGVEDEDSGVNGVSDESDAEDGTSESGEAESSDEDERPRKRRRKKGKGKGGTGNNGILKFNGLD